MLKKREFSPVRWLLLAIGLMATLLGASGAQASDLLPSWNDGAAKKSIAEFVAKVTEEGSRHFVPPAGRIAVFDNDGTLWCEKPMYFEVAFAMERIRATADAHPDRRSQQPFKAILEKDRDYLGRMSAADAFKLIPATHAGMTQAEFKKHARSWLRTARHPRFNRPYTELVYQPMLELLAYLRANGFKTFISSGGTIDFIRTFAEDVYGIPCEQVIGTSLLAKFEMRDGKSTLVRLPEFVKPINDKAGKPVGLERYIGRRPIIAVGNSDGDLQMLQYTDGGPGPALMMLVHHDDAEREYSYTKGTIKALEEAKRRKWTIAYIKRDFKTVFPFDNR